MYESKEKEQDLLSMYSYFGATEKFKRIDGVLTVHRKDH